LIAAFNKVSDSLPEPYTFVIAGQMGTEESDIGNIKEAIDRYGIRDKVLFTGYVPGICIRGEKELRMALLMNGADLLVYPSLYEGFGLPVLEAMACALPVLTSDIPVLREVAGDAAIFVNPYKIDDIAQGIYRGLTDDSLRRKIVLRGRERAKKFNWKDNASRTLEYYEDVFDRMKRKKS
jgi:glycosyltransferase involved in cell wall biosynthesis